MKFSGIVVGMCIMLCSSLLFAQNVGINTTNPQETLHVNGSVRVDGKFILYNGTELAPGATIAIPDNTSMVQIGSNAGAQANALTGPATPRQGMILYILNRDNDAGTFATYPVPGNGQVSQFVYHDGAWYPVGGGSTTPPGAILGGTIAGNGNVVNGPITANRTGTGQYTITFNTPLASTPNVVVSGYMNSGAGGGCSSPPCTDAPTITLDPITTMYCIPHSAFSSGDTYRNRCSAFNPVTLNTEFKFIDGVSTTGGVVNINHASSGCNGQFSPNFGHSITGGTVSINPSATFQLSTTHGATSGSSNFRMYIWVDWNQDGDFDDTGELVHDSGVDVPNLTNVSITAPCSANCGLTRMRIRGIRPGVTALTDACSDAGQSGFTGETHDYNVNILDPTTTAPGFCLVSGMSNTGFNCRCYDQGGLPLDLGVTFLASE
ncbi:MAG: GEVED domain-containing protein [Bacteroidetes bacterium]|nr:GEVED domain-containing protein [Bacteroidota bacterium]